MTKQPYDFIATIFNPNSTNNAEKKAEDFAKQAEANGFKVELIATKKAGHAYEIAKSLVEKYKRPLIISASGDGGYNEVINGIIDGKKQSPSSQPVCAIIAAGNANDHKRLTRQSTPLIKLLKANKPRHIDLIKLSYSGFSRHAHSYIGLGITPKIGLELNRHDLNRLREMLIVVKSFYKFRPFFIRRDGQRQKLSSLVFANIPGIFTTLLVSQPPIA